MCAADRDGAALGDPDATWLAAWIAGVPPTATVLGLPDPPPWPGELAEGTEADRADRRAAVLAAAAAMAEATLILPVDDALGAALARTGGDDLLVLRVRPWEPAALDALLAGGLEPADERPAWVDALLAATGGWPGATVRAIAACARLGLARPEAAAVAAAAGSVHGELTPGHARLVLAATWSDAPQAIALAAKLEVREGPGSHRKALFVVQGGSRVRIVDRGSGWLRIRLPDGLEGWAPQAELGELRTP